MIEKIERNLKTQLYKILHVILISLLISLQIGVGEMNQ